MKLHILSGFLGAGKTTAIQMATTLLQQQAKRVGVITNDQGIQLVDAGLFNSLSIPTRQVVNGCFCCNYQQLDESIESLVGAYDPEILFAESVGSCTDIVATVLKPLLHFRPLLETSFSTFADARLLQMILSGKKLNLDSSVDYVYHKQLEEAAVIVVNKTDLLTPQENIELERMVTANYPGKKIILQNSLNEDSVLAWLSELNESPNKNIPASLDIDYDIYGAGEAQLAWLDQEVSISARQRTAAQTAYTLVNTIVEKLQEAGHYVGHLKFMLNGKKISYTSPKDTMPLVSSIEAPAMKANLLINARVQTSPELLQELVSDAIVEASALSGDHLITKNLSAFQPGYPRPLHRFV